MDHGVDEVKVPMTWKEWWADVRWLIRQGYDVQPPDHLFQIDGPRPEYTRVTAQ